MKKETRLLKLRERKEQRLFIEKRKLETKLYILEHPEKPKSLKIKYRQIDKAKKKFKDKTDKIKETYNFKRYVTLHPSGIAQLTLKRKNKNNKLFMNYTINKPYDINIIKLVNSKSLENIKYILLSVKIQSKEWDADNEKIKNLSPIFITQTFNEDTIQNLDSNSINELVNQWVLKNSNESFVGDNNNIIGVYIRFIYENIKTIE